MAERLLIRHSWREPGEHTGFDEVDRGKILYKTTVLGKMVRVYGSATVELVDFTSYQPF